MSTLSITTVLVPGTIEQMLKVHFRWRPLKPESEATLSTSIEERLVVCAQG